MRLRRYCTTPSWLRPAASADGFVGLHRRYLAPVSPALPSSPSAPSRGLGPTERVLQQRLKDGKTGKAGARTTRQRKGQTATVDVEWLVLGGGWPTGGALCLPRGGHCQSGDGASHGAEPPPAGRAASVFVRARPFSPELAPTRARSREAEPRNRPDYETNRICRKLCRT